MAKAKYSQWSLFQAAMDERFWNAQENEVKCYQS